MTDHTDPHHIRHGADGSRAVPVAPDAAQAHARIVEALADPFAFAVALLADAAVRMPAPAPAPLPRTRDRAGERKPRTAEEILKPRVALPDLGHLSNRSKRDA
jgi:hypothetical protein